MRMGNDRFHALFLLGHIRGEYNKHNIGYHSGHGNYRSCSAIIGPHEESLPEDTAVVVFEHLLKIDTAKCKAT